MDNIVIGITHDLSSEFEEILLPLNYTKTVKDEGVYFQFTDYWDHPHNPISPEIMTYLITIAGYDSYGFIRVGKDPEDNEVHGAIQNFGMTFERAVSIP